MATFETRRFDRKFFDPNTKVLVDISENLSRLNARGKSMVGTRKSKSEKKKPERLLTEVELELMNVIWELGPCTVKDVLNALPKGRDLAYTSVATIMKILEQKGALKSEKQERAHTYSPVLTRSDYEAMTLRHLTTNVFRGDPSSIVMRLLDDSDLSSQDMEAIRAIVEKRSRK